jgi:hypothetical protein
MMPCGLGGLGGNLVQSGNKWGWRQLAAFNIKVVDVDTQTFFGNSVLPEPMVSSVILDNSEQPTTVTLNKADMDFFGYMEDVTNSPNEKSFVVDFAASVLRMMHYDKGHCLVQVQKKMRFEMCGQCVEAKVDVCILEHSAVNVAKYLLLVQGKKVCKPYLCVLKICLLITKYHMSGNHPEPQLIAGAIAALHGHNRALKAAGLPLLQSQTFPGITMVGTAPMFYKIPVTSDLLHSLATLQYPSQVTTVERLIPPVPLLGRLKNDGMKPLVNRHIILQCFEAFKQFVVSYSAWVQTYHLMRTLQELRKTVCYYRLPIRAYSF